MARAIRFHETIRDAFGPCRAQIPPHRLCHRRPSGQGCVQFPTGSSVIPKLSSFLSVSDLLSQSILQNNNFTQLFAAATAIGVWLLRKRRAAAGIPPTGHRAPNIAIVLKLCSCIFLIIMPWMYRSGIDSERLILPTPYPVWIR